jgi:aromatic ring-opening dioxygenase catalytic subunit (LigB family)|tara:strand:- start:395 stop:1222 length:828 start_codon:yes stop_codon:yes gene_type:complete
MMIASDPATDRTMPTLFVPHGAGPCFFMEWNPPTAWNAMADFLRGIAATLPAKPTAIVLISGHWLQSTFSVTSAARPALVYDYHGFPPHTYELRYPAAGEPRLAARIAGLLEDASLGGHEDAQRGFDHGMFIPLKLMFPDADIPVVQLSLRSDLDPQAHIEAGRALQGLRKDGVLIVGSGMSFHNMRGYGDPRFAPISDEFDRWLSAAVESAPEQRDLALQRWEQAPSARLCHPPRAEEHLLPLLVAAGAGGDSIGRKVFSDRVMHTTLSAYRFG